MILPAIMKFKLPDTVNVMDEAKDRFVVCKKLCIPSSVSSVAFGHAGHLFVGSDDGSLRVYDLSTFKTIKAVRGLGAEVSSIICVKRAGSELRDAWLAHGSKISKFQLDSSKMIQDLSDAEITIKITETKDDVLNELALSANKDHLAFSLDTGVVGVVDLSNNVVTKMRDKHENICGSVKFIPDRPRELVSGGYDTYLLHFDIVKGRVLTRRQMDPYTVVGGMALSPPFIMSLAVSSTGVIAAGTADGRLLIGFGGEKGSTTDAKTKKKAKRWNGFDQDESLLIKVAEGPIVTLAFTGPRRLFTSTLMGVLTLYNLNYDEGTVILQQNFQEESHSISKVNALVADDKCVILAGLTEDGKGVIEIWKQEESTKCLQQI